MKHTALPPFPSLTALAVGVALLLTGCGTTANYQQADKTGAGIADYRTAILNMKKSADSTLKALGQIEASATTNPRKAFDQYTKEVKHLEASIAKARASGQDMREKGDAYFSRWDAQSTTVKNPDVKKLAEQRKVEMRDAFDRIKKVTDPLNAKLDPWVSDLKDLQNYLGNDLTIAGVNAAKKLFDNAKADGAEVQKACDDLVAELNSISATLTPASVPEASTTKPQTKH